MRVPTIDCRDAVVTEQERSSFTVTCIIMAGGISNDRVGTGYRKDS